MDNNADNLLGKIRTQAQSFNVPSSPYNAPSLDYLRPAPINVNKDAGKLKFNEFTNISQDTVFKELSDGSKVSMYKNFIPGTDNNERLAQQQTGWEQVKNGLIKAKLNMDSVILGNTVGFVYGLADWARTGNFNSVYDNSFSNTLADWNTTLNYQLPNYVSQQEKDLSIVGKMGTANFWANDIANGLSFTMGTIVSEAIWASATGGASLAVRLGRLGAGVGRAGRWSKVALGLEKTAEGVRGYKALLNTALDNAVVAGKLSTKTATTLAKTGEVLNTARFIATSSGNEAGIEALHYKREQRENYLDNFEKLNGRAPSQEEISDFEEKLNDSANGVFGANMAILSVSNLATFGKMFNIKTPLKSISTQANKSLFGVGVEKTAEGVYKGLQATKFQKGLGLAYTLTKPFATEGLFEEGLQGATTKTANNWIESSYDPKYMGKTMSLGVASSKALSEQYGSKEGWEEVVIGGIVGLIGGGPTGQFTELKRARKEQEDFVAKGLNTFNSVFAQDVLAERFVLNSRLMSAMDRETDALKKRDAVSAHFANNDAIIANMQFEESDIIGGSADDVYRKFETALNAMSKEEFKQAGVENIEEHKENVLSGLKQVVTDFKKASNYANAVLGSDKIAGNTDYNIKVVKDALVHSWVQGQNASRVMSDELGEIGDIVGTENSKVLNTIQTLEALGKDKTREVSKLGRQYKDLDKKSQALQVEIAKVQAAPKETQGDRVKGNLAQQLQARLVDIEARKASIKTELEGIAKELESNNNQKQVYAEQADINTQTSLLGEFVSVDDLLKVDDNLSKLNSIAESVKNNNKVLYNDLTESIERYQNAKQKLYAYNASVSAIVSGEFKLKTTNNFITSMLNKNKTVDERTGEILNYALENYSKINVTEQARVNNDELLNQAIESIKKGEEVETSIIAEIATKIDKGLKLSAKENTIYNAKQEEVDAAVKRINDTPVAKTEQELKIEELEKRKAELESQKQNVSQPTVSSESGVEAKKADVKTKTTKVISSEIVEKGNRKGQTRTVTQTNTIENVEGTLVSITEYEAKVGDTAVTLGGITMTVKEFKEQFPMEEDWGDVLEGLDDNSKITVRKVKRTPTSSRFESVVSIMHPELGKMDIGFEKNDAKYDAEIEALEEQSTELDLTESIVEQINKEIDSINKKIESLKNTGVEKTPIEDVEERIVNATKYFGSEYIGADNPEEMAKKRPSEKDIERYRELKQSKEIQDYETKNQLPLDTALIEEFEKLQDKLSKWRVYDSLVDGQDSVADLLDLREQLLWQEDKEQTVDEILEEDYKDILDEFIKVSGTVTDYTLGDNFNFPPTLKRLENNRISFSFLKFPSIISKFTNPAVTIVSKDGDILDNFENLEQGTTVIVESEGNTFEFVLVEKGRIETDSKNLISMNLTTFSIPSWSYELIYEKVNGEYRTLESDFRDDNMVGDTFQLQEGDSIELFVDANNEYNKQLLEENDKDKLVKDVVIYVVKNGEKYQILKALDKNNSNPEFQKLREVAAKTLKKGKSKVIATTNVSYIHLGLPIVNVGENGKPSPIDFTTSSLDQVVTTGYAFDGEITLADKTLEKDTRKTFVSKLSKNKQGKKLPIVVIKRGKHLIAYPVSLKKSPNPKLNEFDAIVNTTGATDADKVRAVNNLLIENGIAPNKFNLTSWDVNILEAIKTELSNLQQFIAADDLAKTEYDKNSLKEDAQIALDLDDIKRVLPSQKINYDLTTLKYQEKEFQPKETTEEEAKDLVKKAYDKTTTSDDYTKIQDSINEMLDNGASNLEILKFLNSSKIGKELLTEDAEEVIVKDELKVPTESVTESLDEETWNNFVDTGKVPAYVVSKIAEKIVKGETLDARELSIRQEYSKEIEDILNSYNTQTSGVKANTSLSDVKSFETSMGSVYTVLPNGKTQRFKTATGRQSEPSDLIVFVKFENPQQEQNFLSAQNRENGRKLYVVDSSGNMYDTDEQIKGKDVKLAIVESGRVIEIAETSLEPKIGYNTFDQRRFEKNGEKYRSTHLGNDVIKINYNSPKAIAPKRKVSALQLAEGVEYYRTNGTFIYNGTLWGYIDAKFGYTTLIKRASDSMTEDFLKEVEKIKTEKDLNCN
jgi:hypothetical protein